ncbi:hypothetical protein F5X98DRAFT_376602 [Xylaria grammica]|nr:hypothetical protein F5X98DRAFT_376602 [Xylaria grammica]
MPGRAWENSCLAVPTRHLCRHLFVFVFSMSVWLDLKNHVTLGPGTGRNWADQPQPEAQHHHTLLLLDVDRLL